MSQERKPYPSDMSDKEWKLLEPFMPMPKADGRPMEYEWREILNGIFYVLRSGCSWRMMPHDLPDWQSVMGFSNPQRASAFEKVKLTGAAS